MPLYLYRRPRMVVLDSTSSVLDAARAIEQNRIGAVVVQDRGRLVGIVTDRDLAIRVLGQSLDAKTTRIADVMTPSPVVLSLDDHLTDAIRLMQECSVRRIPLVEGGRVVGMVTLDDLLLDEATSLEELGAIVQTQIGEGGPAGNGRTPARRRGLSRAQATLARLVHQVQLDAGLEGPEQASAALDVVAASLARRVTPDEARDFISQLPSLLHSPLGAMPPGPDTSVTRESMEAELAETLGIDCARAAPLLDAVAGTIARSISAGQVEDMRSQLPPELRTVLPYPAARPDGDVSRGDGR